MNTAPAFQVDSSQHFLVQPSSSSRSGRKRAAQDDKDVNPRLLAKRAKAAERQRRKRERDRRNSAAVHDPHQQQRVAFSGFVSQSVSHTPDGTTVVEHQQQQDTPTPQPQVDGGPPQPIPAPVAQVVQHDVPVQAPASVPVPVQHQQQQQQLLTTTTTTATTEEEARKERVRTAARERQRKHRGLVKRKKPLELGTQMAYHSILQELTYTLGPDGNYTPAHPPQTGENEIAGSSHDIAVGENGFLPNGAGQSEGQLFASFVLLALSCSPLLKQHHLRQVHMTNEDLLSLEPVLCAAFEQWDMHVRPIQPSNLFSYSHLPPSSSAEKHSQLNK